MVNSHSTESILKTQPVKSKTGRPPKYKSKEERLAARREAKKKRKDSPATRERKLANHRHAQALYEQKQRDKKMSSKQPPPPRTVSFQEPRTEGQANNLDVDTPRNQGHNPNSAPHDPSSTPQNQGVSDIAYMSAQDQADYEAHLKYKRQAIQQRKEDRRKLNDTLRSEIDNFNADNAMEDEINNEMDQLFTHKKSTAKAMSIRRAEQQRQQQNNPADMLGLGDEHGTSPIIQPPPPAKHDQLAPAKQQENESPNRPRALDSIQLSPKPQRKSWLSKVGRKLTGRPSNSPVSSALPAIALRSVPSEDIALQGVDSGRVALGGVNSGSVDSGRVAVDSGSVALGDVALEGVATTGSTSPTASSLASSSVASPGAMQTLEETNGVDAKVNDVKKILAGRSRPWTEKYTGLMDVLVDCIELLDPVHFTLQELKDMNAILKVSATKLKNKDNNALMKTLKAAYKDNLPKRLNAKLVPLPKVKLYVEQIMQDQLESQLNMIEVILVLLEGHELKGRVRKPALVNELRGKWEVRDKLAWARLGMPIRPKRPSDPLGYNVDTKRRLGPEQDEEGSLMTPPPAPRLANKNMSI